LNGALDKEKLATILELGLKADHGDAGPINFDTSDGLNSCEALASDLYTLTEFLLTRVLTARRLRIIRRRVEFNCKSFQLSVVPDNFDIMGDKGFLGDVIALQYLLAEYRVKKKWWKGNVPWISANS
jgi:hypothetical protein